MQRYEIPSKYFMSDDDSTVESMSPPPLGIESTGNRIYYYGYIEADRILRLTKLLESKEKELIDAYDIPPPIKLYIMSHGGDLFASLGILDIIRKLNVHTIINGVAASGATFMSLAGKKRYMTKHSVVMIHQLHGGANGDYEEIKDEFDNATKFMNIVKSIYSEFTNIDTKKLEEILKHDLYFSAEECRDYGIVDEII
jgi:ATP-dependent Clp protease, protease subunit